MIWQKYADERLLVSVDWALALDGAAVAGDATVSATGGDLTATFEAQEEAVSTLWIAAGTVGASQRVSVSVTTDEGEILTVKVAVTVLE